MQGIVSSKWLANQRLNAAAASMRFSRRSMQWRRGYTIVEIVVVVLILAILAAIAVPRLLEMSIRANEEELRYNLRVLREAIDRYAAEHSGIFPGAKTDGFNPPGDPWTFALQLFMYSDADGKIYWEKHADYPYGPYMTGYIKARFGPAEGSYDLKMVNAGLPLSGESNPTDAWKYDYTTGEFIFNWNGLSSDGVTQYDDF